MSASAPIITIFNEPGTISRRPTAFGDTSFQIKYNFLKEGRGRAGPR